MKQLKILVPTDFSDCALNALDFAIGMAKEIKAEIFLLHTYIENASTFLGKSVVEELNNKRLEEGKSNLNQLLKYIHSKNKDIKASAFLKAGPAVSVINSLAQKENVDLLIMGTLGATGLKAMIVGSYTAEVIGSSIQPVLAIPPDATYKNIHKIVCATDLHPSEVLPLVHLMDFAKFFEATVDLYNVDINQKEQYEKSQLFEKLIQSHNINCPLHLLQDQSDIVESIDHLTRNQKPDLLVTLGRQRSFIEKLFHKSTSKELCLHNLCPLLVFPSKPRIQMTL